MTLCLIPFIRPQVLEPHRRVVKAIERCFLLSPTVISETQKLFLVCSVSRRHLANRAKLLSEHTPWHPFPGAQAWLKRAWASKNHACKPIWMDRKDLFMECTAATIWHPDVPALCRDQRPLGAQLTLPFLILWLIAPCTPSGPSLDSSLALAHPSSSQVLQSSLLYSTMSSLDCS